MLLGSGAGIAQTDDGLATDQDRPAEQSVAAAIHELTKTAKTAEDYSRIIERCEQAVASESTSEKDRAYLQTLMAWACNRRCESQMEAADYLQRAGNSQQARELSDAALADAIRAIELEPTRWRAILNRGVLLAQAHVYDAALADFQRVCELRPQESLAWYNAGEVHNAVGDYESAIDCYGQALSLDSGDLLSLTGRAHAAMQLGRHDAALKDFETVAKWLPGSAAALINRGDAHQALGRWRDAYDDYVAAEKIASDGRATARAAWLLATCPDAEFFRPAAAADLARRSIEQAGRTAENLQSLAAANAALGDFDAAVQNQLQSLEQMDDAAKPAAAQRLELYRQQTAYTQPTPGNPVNVDSRSAQ
jgi:tetratricopeptide (TPR) repeat protein